MTNIPNSLDIPIKKSSKNKTAEKKRATHIKKSPLSNSKILNFSFDFNLRLKQKKIVNIFIIVVIIFEDSSEREKKTQKLHINSHRKKNQHFQWIKKKPHT